MLCFVRYVFYATTGGIPHFIRLGLTRAKALQTVSGFPREMGRRYAAPKLNAFALEIPHVILALPVKNCYRNGQ